METQCTCCGFFWSGKKSGKRDAKAAKPIVKRISKEHLLGYAGESEESANASKAGRQAAKAPSLNHYNPPLNNAENASLENGRTQTFEELRAAMRRAHHGLPFVLPLLRAGVKETSHEFRSHVRLPIHHPFFCTHHFMLLELQQQNLTHETQYIHVSILKIQ